MNGPHQIGSASIRPFHVNVPEFELADLRKRINKTKWPEREPVNDHSQGMRLELVQRIARYWATDYDWRRIESKMNSFPQFMTEIDGLNIHFIHARSKHEKALPLIISHGWPGSIIEQLKIISPLIDPTAHGGKASDAFHVVIPSLPGYGFSGKPTMTGWGPARIASAWPELMRRLGYSRYVAQGGDWGGIITDLLAARGHPELVGIHTNMPGTVPPEIDKLLWTGTPLPAELTADEKLACEKLAHTYKNIQYAFYQSSRPQTLYALTDSPIGLAAWLHDPLTLQLVDNAFNGNPTGLNRDDILDNVTLFWLTRTAISAARLYRENTSNFFAPKGVKIPVAVSVFPDELFPTPRSWAERAYPKLIHFNKVAKDGHFAAWEQPEIFVSELRASFKTLRD